MAIASNFGTNQSRNQENSSGLGTIEIANCILNAPLMLVSIIGNVLVLATILRTPSFRSPSMIFLGNLAVSDLFVALFAQPIYILAYMYTTGNNHLGRATHVMGFSVCGTSLSTITALAVDRVLSLHYHMRYPDFVTTRRALCASATLWSIHVLISLLSTRSKKMYYFAATVSISICLSVCSVCFIKIYRIVHKHQLQINIQQQAVERLNEALENNQRVTRSAKGAKNIFIYYIVMITCYTPLFSAYLTSGIPQIKYRFRWTFPVTVAFFNSSINPVLYCWRHRELRKAVLKTARLICFKGQIETN